MHQCRIKEQLHIIFISNNLHYFSKIYRYVDEFVYICRCRAIYTVHASAITNKFALLSASAYICRCRAIYTVHASAITNKFALLSASA